MREDIKLKKYRMIHKKINDMYCNEFINVTQCCKKTGISPASYYKICSTLGKKSVGTAKKKTNSGSKSRQKSNEKSTKKNTKSTESDDFDIDLHTKSTSKTKRGDHDDHPVQKGGDQKNGTNTIDNGAGDYDEFKELLTDRKKRNKYS